MGWRDDHPDLDWKCYRVAQLCMMILETDDTKKAKRYARTLRKTTDEIVALSLERQQAAAARAEPQGEGDG